MPRPIPATVPVRPGHAGLARLSGVVSGDVWSVRSRALVLLVTAIERGKKVNGGRGALVLDKAFAQRLLQFLPNQLRGIGDAAVRGRDVIAEGGKRFYQLVQQCRDLADAGGPAGTVIGDHD